MDLSGTWRAASSDEDLRRRFHDRGFDDSDWLRVRVPGHWTEVPGLADEESVLYRYRFTGPDPSDAGVGRPAEDAAAVAAGGAAPAADAGADRRKRWWLRFEGLAQQGDVWLDGAYLGHTDGYFVPHEMEVTQQIEAQQEHVLAVEAVCRRFGDPDKRSTLTGALQDPELVGSDRVVIGGLWRPAKLRASGLIAIRHARAVCADVLEGRGSTPPRARLALRAVLDVPEATPVELRTRVAGTRHVHTHPAAAGENRVEWTVDVDDPELWWPHALGDQILHTLTVEAMAGSVVCDTRRFRIGFRTVSMRRLILSVNGERIHLKGVNLLPVRALLGTASPAEAADDVRAAREAGLDAVRPVAHIARPELYEAADELGVLVWQDLPIRGLMSRSVGREARRQAREAADLLGHHPSVAVWCAHDEPFARSERKTLLPTPVSWQGPSWNRDVLDRGLCRVLDRCDGSRPVVAHTAVPPRWSDPDGTTSNAWLDRHTGGAADLSAALARFPRQGRFISSVGAPGTEGAGAAVKAAIEVLRRLKYRPNGGFFLSYLADMAGPADASCLADMADSDGAGPIAAAVAARPDGTGMPDPERGAPGAGRRALSLLDSGRRPKPAWAALVEACKPLIVVSDPLPPEVHAGSRIDLAVHVVNDRREAVDELTVRARVLGPRGSISERGWTGSAGADECVLVGRIQADVPASPPGCGDCRLAVELQLLVSGEIVAENRSRTRIVRMEPVSA